MNWNLSNLDIIIKREKVQMRKMRGSITCLRYGHYEHVRSCNLEWKTTALGVRVPLVSSLSFKLEKIDIPHQQHYSYISQFIWLQR